MEFKPKGWVLVRDDEKEKWKLDIFSHFVDRGSFPYICVGSYYDECLPYEGNEALLGTTDAPKEKHVWHAGDRVDVLSDFDDMWHPGFIVEIDYTRSVGGFYYRVESECFKSITSTGKVWCKADQLRRSEKKPDNAEAWRPKEGEAIEVLVDDEWQAATLVLDDHTDNMPYRVRLDSGEFYWCHKNHIRPAQKKTEEPFKFDDKVEANINGKWREAIFLKNDGSCVPYHVATTDGATWWCEAEDVRRA